MIITRRKLRKPSTGAVVCERYEGPSVIPTTTSSLSSSAVSPEEQQLPEESARSKRAAAPTTTASSRNNKKANMVSSRKRKTGTPSKNAASSSSFARPMVLLPLPMLHLPGSGGGGKQQKQAAAQQQQHEKDGQGSGEYHSNDDESLSSNDSSYHSVEPPPQASQAVAQLIDDKIERQRAAKEAQLERQALVQRERARGEQDNHDIRLLIYLHALRAEEVKRERKKQKKLEKQQQQQAFCISAAHIDTRQAKVDLEQKLQFPEQTFAQAELKHNSIVMKKKAPQEEVVHFENIGTVPPSLASMIAQAATELRPVPKQHKTEFKPICNDAAEIGKFLRLKEEVVVAQGTGERQKRLDEQKQQQAEAESTTGWTKGKASVTLPKFDNCRSEAFNIVNEAAALGKLVSLKPQVTRNYDPVLDYMDDEDEDDVDVLAVDEQGHKDFRIKYLTDVHVRHHQQSKKKDWEVENLDQTVHYDLDKVELPTGALPVYTKPRKQLSEMEIKEGIAQGVAEALWERQYRLERPEAELRMRPACSCRYCQTSNPYQTHAYRKKWLIRQGIWVEPPPMPEPRKKSRHDPLVDLRKRLKVEKAKEEQIRREAERQKWLAESKDLYSKSRLKSTPKDAPVELDPEAEAVEQRKENLAVAQQRKLVKPKTAPVTVIGESVSTRMERFQNNEVAGKDDESSSAAAEVGPTTWERDTKGRWIARAAREPSAGTTSSSAPAEWAQTTTIGFRQAPPKSKTKPPPSFIPPPSSPSKRSFNSIAERVRVAMSPKDVKLKPISKSSPNDSSKQTGQPAKKRMEFLKNHLKPPFSPKNSKSNKSVTASSKLPKGQEAPAQLPQPPMAQSKTKKKVPPKSLKERLVEKRREILKIKPPPSTPSDVKLKPVAKVPRELPVGPADKKKNEFLNVRLKPTTSSHVGVEHDQGPRLLSQSKSMATSTKPDDAASSSSSVDEEEVEDITIYDDSDYEEEEIMDYEEEEIIEYIDDDEDEYEEEILEESESSVEEILLDESGEEYSESTEEVVEDSSSYDEDYIEQEIIDEPESILGGSIVRNLWNDIIDIIEEGDEGDESIEEEATNSEIQDHGDSMYFEESEANGDSSSAVEVSESENEASQDISKESIATDDNEVSRDFEPQEQLSISEALEAPEDISKESMAIDSGIDTALDNVPQETSNTANDSAQDENSNADCAKEIVQRHSSNADTAVDTTTHNDRKPERKRSGGMKDKKKGVFKQLGRTFGSILGRKKKGRGARLSKSADEANLDPFGSSPLAPSNADLTSFHESKSPSQAETSEGEKLSQAFHESKSPSQAETSEGEKLSQDDEAPKGDASVAEPVPESNETHAAEMPIPSTAAENSTASDHVVDLGVEEDAAESAVDAKQLELIEEELELIKEELEIIEEEGAMEDASPSKVQAVSRDGQSKSPNPQEGHELAGNLDSQPVEELASALHNVPDEAPNESISGTDDAPFDEESIATG